MLIAKKVMAYCSILIACVSCSASYIDHGYREVNTKVFHAVVLDIKPYSADIEQAKYAQPGSPAEKRKRTSYPTFPSLGPANDAALFIGFLAVGTTIAVVKKSAQMLSPEQHFVWLDYHGKRLRAVSNENVKKGECVRVNQKTQSLTVVKPAQCL